MDNLTIRDEFGIYSIVIDGKEELVFVGRIIDEISCTSVYLLTTEENELSVKVFDNQSLYTSESNVMPVPTELLTNKIYTIPEAEREKFKVLYAMPKLFPI